MQTNCEFGFSMIFNYVKSLSTKLNVTIDIPIQPKRQLNRNTVPNTGPEDFDRNTVYIPMLDNIIADITEHFSEQLTNFLDINILVSSR
jgi:hypothetical protein